MLRAMDAPGPIAGWWDALGRADWLTAARARAWCRVLALLSLATVVWYLATSHGGADAFGRPLGTDFVSFWTAGRAALAGQAASAYDTARHAAAERALFARAGDYAFFYPPPFLLVCTALAALPYPVALTVWLAAGLALVWACLRRLLPRPWAVLPILAAPALLVAAGHGQTALLTTACLGWSMILAERRPLLAGACLGLLVAKPHLLLSIPLALAASRRWHMLAGAVAGASGICALSWLLLGAGTWRGFRDVLPDMRAMLEHGLVGHWKLVSAFAAIRLLHGGIAAAYAAQAVTALAGCVVLAGAVRGRPGAAAEGALRAAAAPLCAPLLLDYDLACLLPALAWVTGEATRGFWLRWEKLVLLAGYALPLLARPVALVFGLPLAPPVLLALLLVVARRARLTPSAGGSRTAPPAPDPLRRAGSPPRSGPSAPRRSGG
jgi:hypothetical protein